MFQAEQLQPQDRNNSIPEIFNQRAQESLSRREQERPVLIKLSEPNALHDVEDLVKEHPHAHYANLAEAYVNDYVSRLYPGEYRQALAAGPDHVLSLKKEKLGQLGMSLEDVATNGAVFYSPIFNSIIAYAPDEIHYAVRTASNRGVIDEETQRMLRDNERFGFVGLSVGMAQAQAVFMLGARNIKGLDFDRAEGPNFNRLPIPLSAYGMPKARIAEETLLLADPYATIDFKNAPLDETTIDDFLMVPSKLTLLFDEVDSTQAKDLIQDRAMKLGIDVVSLADLGQTRTHGIYIPFASEAGTLPFNGKFAQLGLTWEQWQQMPPQSAVAKLATIIGPHNAGRHVLEAVPRIASGQLASWPQDAATIFSAAGTAGYLSIMHAQGKAIPKEFVLDNGEKINPDYTQEMEQAGLLAQAIMAQLASQK